MSLDRINRIAAAVEAAGHELRAALDAILAGNGQRQG